MRKFLAAIFALLAIAAFAHSVAAAHPAAAAAHSVAAAQVRGSGLQPRQTLFALQGASAPEDKAAPLLWKTVTNAYFRVNDSGVKEWNMFQIEKKHDRFLVQIADRFLFVDADKKQVFELANAGIHRSGSDILWDPADKPARPLATSAWLVRDVGLAWRIKMRLDAEDRTLDLQIPHPASRP
jgi:hypothetical protein